MIIPDDPVHRKSTCPKAPAHHWSKSIQPPKTKSHASAPDQKWSSHNAQHSNFVKTPIQSILLWRVLAPFPLPLWENDINYDKLSLCASRHFKLPKRTCWSNCQVFWVLMANLRCPESLWSLGWKPGLVDWLTFPPLGMDGNGVC